MKLAHFSDFHIGHRDAAREDLEFAELLAPERAAEARAAREAAEDRK